MIDRQKVAVALVVLGSVLAGVSTFQSMYVVVQKMPTVIPMVTMSLWGAQSRTTGGLEINTLVSAALPVLALAVLMVVAAVFTLRGWPVARLVVLGAAGAFAGVVLAFVTRVIYEKELYESYDMRVGAGFELTYSPGLYLLVAAAILGLVGAVLVQRAQPVQPVQPDEEEAVVVHQLMDDDTPPFGIAMPQEEESR